MARQQGSSAGTAVTLDFAARLWQDSVRASAMQDEASDARP
jgi:hypothetical protein